jgi:drug/metabolite transporter (DMT)-like permease
MINLAFAVLCSVGIGMVFKHAGRLGLDRTALLTVNYAAAVAVGAVLVGVGGRSVSVGLDLSPALVALSVGTGAILIAGFFILAVATDEAGMSLATGVMRVSVVIPFLASWLVWDEVPSLAQGAGMVLAAVAFFLIAQKERRPESAPVGASVGGGHEEEPTGPQSSAGPVIDWRAFGVLALTFCSGGAVDLSMKTFEEGFGDTNSRVLFLMGAFGVAFLLGAVVVGHRALRYGRWPEWRTVGWGLVLGVINYGSLEFLLRAVEVLPGTVVFPANNIAIMVLAAAVGVFFWNEHLSRANRVGIGLAVAALVLLRL